MNIRFEQTSDKELEVVVKGDINDKGTIQVLSLLNNISEFGKILLLDNDESFLFDVSEIVYFETHSGKTFAFTQNKSYEVKEKLYEIAEKHGGNGFVQINKGTVVNINFVKSISAEFSGNYLVRLKEGKNTLTISRKYFSTFKQFIRR